MVDELGDALRDVARAGELGATVAPFSAVTHRARVRVRARAIAAVATVVALAAGVPTVLAAGRSAAPLVPAKVVADPSPSGVPALPVGLLPTSPVLPPQPPASATWSADGVQLHVGPDSTVWLIGGTCPAADDCRPRLQRWTSGAWHEIAGLPAMHNPTLNVAEGRKVAVVGRTPRGVVGAVSTDGGDSWTTVSDVADGSPEQRATELVARDMVGGAPLLVDWQRHTVRTSWLGIPDGARTLFQGDIGEGTIASASGMGREPFVTFAFRSGQDPSWRVHDSSPTQPLASNAVAAGATIVFAQGSDSGTPVSIRLLQVSRDRGVSWREIDVAREPVVSLTVHVLDDGRVVAAGFAKQSGSPSASSLFIADPDRGVFEPLSNSPTGVIDVAVSGATIVVRTQETLQISRDRGSTWQQVGLPVGFSTARSRNVALLAAAPPGAGSDLGPRTAMMLAALPDGITGGQDVGSCWPGLGVPAEWRAVVIEGDDPALVADVAAKLHGAPVDVAQSVDVCPPGH